MNFASGIFSCVFTDDIYRQLVIEKNYLLIFMCLFFAWKAEAYSFVNKQRKCVSYAAK